jgi:phospholipase C
VLVINRDEWGGFFDHVTPPRVIAPNSIDTDLVNGQALLGCRVPTLIVSPFARGAPAQPRINSQLYDHTSVLKLIEWRWGLEPLTSRDASDEVGNLAYALNFNSTDTSLPQLPVIAEPSIDVCTFDDILDSSDASDVENEAYDFLKMLESDLTSGWPIPAG